MKPPSFCFSAFLLICFFLPPALSENITTDAKALLDFKDITGNKGNKNLSSWNTSSIPSICTTWAGVVCSNESTDAQRVTVLWLSGNSLSGQIPSNVLGSLSALQNLSLGLNRFSGEFPSDLANCTSLRGLYLQNKKFSGPLSASAFSAWPSLMEVDLSLNQLNGSIPQSISNASMLQLLNLQNNSFSWAIPPITTLQLQSFNVANNELNGSIPASLARFSATSFAGNDGLCGGPLQNTCSSPSSPPSHKPKELSAGAKAGIVIGSVYGVSLLLLGLTYIAWGNSDRRPSARVTDEERVQRLEDNGEGGTREAHEGQPFAKGENKLVFVDNNNKGAFDIEELLTASAEVMGKGSLGTSYKAMLENDLKST